MTSRMSRSGAGNAAVLLALLAVAVALLFVQSAGLVEWRDPGTERLGAAVAVALLYAGFCAGVAWRRRLRSPAASVGGDALLIVHASQTGTAEAIALHTAQSLSQDGRTPPVVPLGDLESARLTQARRILFIVSTTGDGDAPDGATGFTLGPMAQPVALHTLEYAVLALGDRGYAQFCGFGRQLDQWLSVHGAARLFERVEVDSGDPEALAQWHAKLTTLGAADTAPRSHTAPLAPWTLQQRRLLNPGSQGGAAYHLSVTPRHHEKPVWQPGDIAVIQPKQSPDQVRDWLHAMAISADAAIAEMLLSHRLPAPGSDDALALRALPPSEWAAQLPALPLREYSIASQHSDGTLDLVVRQIRLPGGALSLGSGWLTELTTPGDTLHLRVRENRNFHPPADDRPMILIGNGTGIAGLRAHLRARASLGRHRNWLLFGERNEAADFLFGDEIRQWQTRGVLARLDLAFSRDQSARVYVQHRLHEAADTLKAWIADGASIYVCGSREGMAPGVHAALVDALGQPKVDALMAEQRYRRDVY